MNERGGQITAAIQHLCPLEQIIIFSDGKGPMTTRFVEYLDLSEPDAPILSLMNEEKRPLITDDFTKIS